jgi:WD40 repeat protein
VGRFRAPYQDRPMGQAKAYRTAISNWHRTGPLLLGLLLVFSGDADEVKSLSLSHRIGTDWEEGSHRWMNFVALSADGKTVASNGAVPGGTAGMGLWTFPEGKFIRSVAGSPISLSSDFKLLATEDSVLDLTVGREVFRLSREDRLWTHAAFSATGEFFAFTGYRVDGKPDFPRITVIRTSDGSVVRKFGRRHTAGLAIHPDNRTLASGHWDNVTLWDMRSGQQTALLAGFGRYVYGIGFSRDGKLLAAGTDDGQLQIWELGGRRRLHSLRIGWGDVSNPAFSPDGKTVAAGTYADGMVSVVDVQSGAILSQTKVSMFGCGSVVFSPDGKYLITPSNGGQLGPKRFDQGGSIRVFRVSK